jgi:hypothetical protein
MKLKRGLGRLLERLFLPLVFEKGNREEEGGGSDYHVGFVSHGLCLFEVVNALLRLDPEKKVLEKYRGHYNTGWSRFEISIQVCVALRVPPLSSVILIRLKNKDERGEGRGYDVNSPTPLEVCLVTFDSHDHLTLLVCVLDNLSSGRVSFVLLLIFFSPLLLILAMA